MFGGDLVIQDNRRDWREICDEVLHETDHDRLNSLLQELLDALEDRERLRRHGTSPSLRE